MAATFSNLQEIGLSVAKLGLFEMQKVFNTIQQG